MKHHFPTLLLMLLLALPTAAQRPRIEKLSPMLRQLVREQRTTRAAQLMTRGSRSEVCAFVRINGEATDVLSPYGGRSLAQFGNIHIAALPIGSIAQMTLDDRIMRIEAQRGEELQCDSINYWLNALGIHEGTAPQLPQAFTGAGIMMGIMDVGFDLTHPNFYSRDASRYRIGHFWDMLSADTVGSAFYVGRDYEGEAAITGLGCSRDGLTQAHGTHTVGIAAGSGYDTPYVGMAPESEICLVANAVTEDTIYIAPDDYYKYTYATDALGFKYIFDQAERAGKPCVISFSEGSGQDFWGYDQLYYEILDSLTGPGRIIVSAAGNEGMKKSWYRKERGVESMGNFLRASQKDMMVTLKSADPFVMRIVAYTPARDTLLISSDEVLAAEDSTATAVIRFSEDRFVYVLAEAYPNCYDAQETCIDLTFHCKEGIGGNPRLSLEVVGADADVETWRVNGNWNTYDENPALDAGECTHNILSPSSAPQVICVGAINHRRTIKNIYGNWMVFGDTAVIGTRSAYSSVGPTMDHRMKPDVMAHGINVISSYSRYYTEANPESGNLKWVVGTSDFKEQSYPWFAYSGTSMASPAVGGAITLWLQVKPDLTTAEALDIISQTSQRPDPTLDYPNNEYGWGEIDVYRGLLYLLEANHIEGLSDYHTKARISVRDGRLVVETDRPVGGNVQVRVFSLDGRVVASKALSGWNSQGNNDLWTGWHELKGSPSTYTLALPQLPQGVYAVQIDGSEAVRGSTLIRL